MSDLISRELVINTIMGEPPEPHYPHWYVDKIRALPTAESEIIQCKDCNKFIPHTHAKSIGWCNYYNTVRESYDFCSRAERRNDVQI